MGLRLGVNDSHSAWPEADAVTTTSTQAHCGQATTSTALAVVVTLPHWQSSVLAAEAAAGTVLRKNMNGKPRQ
jgi:hypothetical protein